MTTNFLDRLIQWRDRTGYIVNESPTYVCPTSLLLIIAGAIPTSTDQLHILYNPLPPHVQPKPDSQVENILEVISFSVKEYNLLASETQSKPSMILKESPPVDPKIEEAEIIQPPTESEKKHLEGNSNGNSNGNNGNDNGKAWKIFHLSIWKVLGIVISIRWIRSAMGLSLFLPPPLFPTFLRILIPSLKKTFTKR